MALTIIDPRIYTDVIVPWFALHVFEPPAGATVENIDISAVTDHADTAPTFDTQHEVFTHSPVNDASQNSIGDNRNGLEDPLRLDPTLTYTYTPGYSSTHETSQGLTIGITQAFNYSFGARAAAPLSRPPAASTGARARPTTTPPASAKGCRVRSTSPRGRCTRRSCCSSSCRCRSPIR
jgi:hypothetical protein